MASYNTIPDLESEAQPLAGAPPRKHGKATLAVVAALAFGAGALAPSAAARVGLTRFDQVYTNPADYDTSSKLTNEGSNGKGYISEDGPPVPPADAAAQGEPFVDCTTLPGGCAPGKQSVDGTGAEDPTVVKNDETPKDGQGAGGVDIDGRK